METNDTINTIDATQRGSTTRRGRRLTLAGAAAAAGIVGVVLSATSPVVGFLTANHNETVLA